MSEFNRCETIQGCSDFYGGHFVHCDKCLKKHDPEQCYNIRTQKNLIFREIVE